MIQCTRGTCSKQGAVHVSAEVSCSPLYTRIGAVVWSRRGMQVRSLSEPLALRKAGLYLWSELEEVDGGKR